MKKNFKHIESRGLPGGPNEQFTYVTGVFSIDGYKSDSPDVNNPFNIIPSADITMKDVDFPVRGYGNNGIVHDMIPGKENYNYGDADYVVEVPMAQKGKETPRATISQYEEPAWYEKAVDYLASPMTALSYIVQGKDLPDRLPINVENRNTYDMVIDMINPAAWYAYAESADRNIAEGNYLNAGFDALGAIPVVPAYLSQGKHVVKGGKNVIKNVVSKLKNSGIKSADEVIYRGVYLNDEIRNLPKFVGKTDDEILDIMGTQIPGPTGTLRKKQWNQTLNFGRDFDMAADHVRRFTNPNSIFTLGNTDDFINGQKYVLKVKPNPGLRTISAEQNNKLYKEVLENTGSKDFNYKAFYDAGNARRFGPDLPIRTEGLNVQGNFPQFIGQEGDVIGELIKAIPIKQQGGVIEKVLPAAQEGIELDQAQLGTFIKKVIKPALKTGSKYLDDLFKSTDNIDDLVEVVTANGSVKKIPRKDAIRLNRVEDANVTNTSFTNYEDGNWFADDLSDFYVNRTKNAMSPVSYDLLDPKDPRRLITMYMDPSDAKNFNLTKGTTTERALNMSGGMGNMPLPSEYVLPPELVKLIRETGKIPGASTFIGDADQVMKNLSDFYKKYGGDISDLDKAQLGLGAFLKRLKPAIKKGANYIDEFIQNDLYKYNPWAYNNIDSKLPEWLQLSGENEKWLRQVGRPAIEDAQVTRTVREIGEDINPRIFAEKLAELQNMQTGQFMLSKRYPGPFFKKGETFFDYRKKSKSGLDGKRNTRGRSGSADYLIEFDPSDPIKYQGMDSYFQPAYMQSMMLDPAPFDKWIGDVAIMKPKMRDVENFNFYKKDPFWAYKKVRLDDLQEGGQAPFDKESWEYYRQQNPEAVMNPPVNDSVVIPPKDGFTKQTFIENLAKPKPELQQPKTLNFNNILDYVINTRGGTKELWGKAADTIAFHESGPWARMDVGAKQHLGGPGRGLFQFEAPSLKTAQKRYTNIAKSQGFTPNPDILNAKSADELNAQDQYTLFFANLIESNAKLSDYAEGKMKLEDLWLKGHKNVEKEGDRNSFLESIKAAEKEGIKGGYNTFEGGGEFTLYDIYKKYVMGGSTDDVSKSIYDKLNRVHYTDAKGLGMSVPNYILTYVMKGS